MNHFFRTATFLLAAMALFSTQPAYAEEVVTRRITVVINEGYAELHPDWQEHAADNIRDANLVFANTGIQFAIEALKTYPDTLTFNGIGWDDTYWHMEDMGEYSSATTVMYLAAVDNATEQSVQNQCPSADMYAVSMRREQRVYNSIYICSSGTNDFLEQRLISGKQALIDLKPLGAEVRYWGKVNSLAHELGHTFGLGIPEYYLAAEGYDNTGVLPKLSAFRFEEAYGADVMANIGHPEPGTFNELSRYILRKNNAYQFTKNSYSYWGNQYANSARLHLQDVSGKPIANASVKVYGIKTNCIICQNDPSVDNLPSPLLETVVTDSQGNAQIQKRPSNKNFGGSSEWTIVAIKVSAPGVSWGGYMTTHDLLRAKTLFSKDEFVLTATVSTETEESPTSLSYIQRLIKMQCGPGVDINHPCRAVYYVGKDGKRHAFPNSRVFFSWYGGFDTVQEITQQEMQLIPLGTNVTYRPGVKLVKFTTVNKVYAVSQNGTLRWVKDENVARALYGNDWNKKIDDIADTFFTNYKFGNDIANPADYNPQAEIEASRNSS